MLNIEILCIYYTIKLAGPVAFFYMFTKLLGWLYGLFLSLAPIGRAGGSEGLEPWKAGCHRAGEICRIGVKEH